MQIDMPRLRHAWDVIRVLVWRDQKARYQSTLMGVVWAVASPVLYLLTFYFLFRIVFSTTIEHYASYVFAGIIAWTWLQTSVLEAVASIVANPSLVIQPRFPLAALPVATTISNLVTFALALPVLLTVTTIESGFPGAAIVALPAVAACQFVLVLAATYLVAATNVTFRDVQHIAPILLQLGFFASPIFYDIAVLPETGQRILALNPIVPILDGYRSILLDGTWPDWTGLGATLALGLVLLALALRNFQSASRRFLEEI
jgi:ABC-type polysaccharide/polyol phosphate export permease